MEIQATDNLMIAIYPTGTRADQPLLKLYSVSDEEQQVMIVLQETRSVIEALAHAATLLAELEAKRHNGREA